jgi:hypothetical protein
VPWRGFTWQFGRADGGLDEEEFHPPTRHCGNDMQNRRYPRDEDAWDTGHKRSSPRNFISKVSSWIDGRGRSRDRNGDRDRGRSWHRGETSRGRARTYRDSSPPSTRANFSAEERRAHGGLWQCKGKRVLEHEIKAADQSTILQEMEGNWTPFEGSVGTDAIEIIPQDKDLLT